MTPAVEEEARRLTPPNQLDMAEVVEEQGCHRGRYTEN